MSKQKDNVSNLLAAINRQSTQATASKPDIELPSGKQAEPKEPTKQVAPRNPPAPKKTKTKRGGPVQFWLHDNDRKVIRELAAWLAGQGLRTTDSQVLRAALRLAKTGSALVESFHEVERLDGRRKQD